MSFAPKGWWGQEYSVCTLMPQTRVWARLRVCAEMEDSYSHWTTKAKNLNVPQKKPVSRWSGGASFKQPSLRSLKSPRNLPRGIESRAPWGLIPMPTASLQAPTSKNSKHKKSRTTTQMSPGLGKRSWVCQGTATFPGLFLEHKAGVRGGLVLHFYINMYFSRYRVVGWMVAPCKRHVLSPGRCECDLICKKGLYRCN